MAIALPSSPTIQSAEIFVLDFGSELTPFLGGAVQRLNRIGTRLGLRATLPPLEGDDARVIVMRLIRGKQERVLLRWPLGDFSPGAPGTPLIGASSGGTALSLNGLTAGYTFVEGQPLSVIHSGRRYVHLCTGPATANGSGIAAISIFPPTRVTYSVDDVVEVAEPMIEGLVSPGDELGWSMATDHLVMMSFTVIETK